MTALGAQPEINGDAGFARTRYQAQELHSTRSSC
jgi:hypothetical protein